jgi:hypothetical protein
MDDIINGNKIPLPDLTYLKTMADGDETFIREIIKIFLEEGPVMLKSMKDCAEAGDHDKLKLVTHKLITQLTSVGIVTAVADVKRINKGSRDMVDLNETVDRILKISNVSIEHLKTMI